MGVAASDIRVPSGVDGRTDGGTPSATSLLAPIRVEFEARAAAIDRTWLWGERKDWGESARHGG